MAYKALLFGMDNFYSLLKPLYEAEAKRGTLEIVATAVIENDTINLVYADGRRGEVANFDLAIISSHGNFYRRMKQLESMGVPRDRIIDGRVFRVPNFDFPRLLAEGVAYSTLERDVLVAKSYINYPQVYKNRNGKITLSLGRKSYVRGCKFEGSGFITAQNFCYMATDIFFGVGINASHNWQNVGMIPACDMDWAFPKEFLPPQGTCKILIGNDVWIGRGCNLKSVNPNRPLIIGDGAVIASDSVVVKNVPPYAIVGGNPAQIIKYRFEPHIIDALLRIKWWDWDIDKIHDNFKYFNDVEKFIALHDN